MIVMFCDVNHFYKSSMFDDIKSTQHYFYKQQDTATAIAVITLAFASTQDNFEIHIYLTFGPKDHNIYQLFRVSATPWANHTLPLFHRLKNTLHPTYSKLNDDIWRNKCHDLHLASSNTDDRQLCCNIM